MRNSSKCNSNTSSNIQLVVHSLLLLSSARRRMQLSPEKILEGQEGSCWSQPLSPLIWPRLDSSTEVILPNETKRFQSIKDNFTTATASYTFFQHLT
uniref:HDC15651 n=1 Tax=Drosophila melanogaster TaxID=7227 RepID=Q6IJ88_DROME|nr:TPA_inf: HDC15651 [Drosophila melanogaster]